MRFKHIAYNAKLNHKTIKIEDFSPEDIFGKNLKSPENSKFIYCIEERYWNLVLFNTEEETTVLRRFKMNQDFDKVSGNDPLALRPGGPLSYSLDFFNENEVIIYSERMRVYIPPSLPPSLHYNPAPLPKREIDQTKDQRFEFFIIDPTSLKESSRFSYEREEKVNLESFAPITLKSGRVLVMATSSQILGFNFNINSLSKRFEFDFKAIEDKRFRIGIVKELLSYGYVDDNVFCLMIIVQNSKGTFYIHFGYLNGDVSDGDFGICGNGKLPKFGFLPKNLRVVGGVAIGYDEKGSQIWVGKDSKV